MASEGDAIRGLNGLDDELAAWSQSWRAAGGERPIDAAELRRQVRRRTVLYRLGAAAETAVGIGMLGFLGWFAANPADGWDVVVAAALAALCIAIMVRGLQVAGRHWSPAGNTTADFLALMVARGRAMRRQLLVGWALLVAEVAVLAPWVAHTLRRRYGAEAPLDAALWAWGYLVVVAALAATALVLLRRHNERSLARWVRLSAEAGEP